MLLPMAPGLLRVGGSGRLADHPAVCKWFMGSIPLSQIRARPSRRCHLLSSPNSAVARRSYSWWMIFWPLAQSPRVKSTLVVGIHAQGCEGVTEGSGLTSVTPTGRVAAEIIVASSRAESVPKRGCSDSSMRSFRCLVSRRCLGRCATCRPTARLCSLCAAENAYSSRLSCGFTRQHFASSERDR